MKYINELWRKPEARRNDMRDVRTELCREQSRYAGVRALISTGIAGGVGGRGC